MQHQRRWNDAVLENLLIVVNVFEETIQSGDALDDAALDLAPLPGSQDARNDIEREDPVDLVAAGVDRKSDAEVEQLALRSQAATPEVGQGVPVEDLLDLDGAAGGEVGRSGQFAIETAGVVALEKSLRLPLAHTESCAVSLKPGLRRRPHR